MGRCERVSFLWPASQVKWQHRNFIDVTTVGCVRVYMYVVCMSMTLKVPLHVTCILPSAAVSYSCSIRRACVTLSNTVVHGTGKLMSFYLALVYMYKSCFFCTWYSQSQWQVDHSHTFTRSHMLSHTPPLGGPEEWIYPTTIRPQLMNHCFKILSFIFFGGKGYFKVHRKAG